MKKIVYALMFLAFASFANAQWEPDLRLTIDSSDAITSRNNAWCVAANGNNVHVVWHDYRVQVNGWSQIYYKRSTNGGVSWGADTRLTNQYSEESTPSVSVSGSVVHIVWTDIRLNNTYEIYYKRSTDGGISWGLDTRLTNKFPYASESPSISVSGSVVHVVWRDLRDDSNGEIYYKRSTDGGISWGADTRLTNNSALSDYPSVAVSGSNVNVVWRDYRNGTSNSEIYYKRSSDGGISWQADTRLTNDSFISEYPCISVSGSVVHVVWSDDRDGHREIYYKRSTDGGISWEADTQLTFTVSYLTVPSITVSGSFVHVVWEDDRDAGLWEIYYKRSTDGGNNWGPDTRLTNNPAYSQNPSVAASDSVVHVVWHDERNGNYDIYYKRNPTGNVIGIQNISTEIPSEYSLSQNYPNPFNPTTNIKFAVPRASTVKITVFDVSGREVWTIVNEQLKAGTYQTEWNASAYSSGVYFYKIQSGDFSETKKMILIK